MMISVKGEEKKALDERMKFVRVKNRLKIKANSSSEEDSQNDFILSVRLIRANQNKAKIATQSN